VLLRSGTISEKRYQIALTKLAEWGADVQVLDVEHSTGAITAKAVGVLHNINRQIREKSGGLRSLDDVARALAENSGPVTREKFYSLVDAMSQPGSQ